MSHNQLIIHQVSDFGIAHSVVSNSFGLALAQAIVNDYLLYRLPSGNPQLIKPENDSVYVASLMESVEGFDQLSHEQIEYLIIEATYFFRTFVDRIDDLTKRTGRNVWVYPTASNQKRVALII